MDRPEIPRKSELGVVNEHGVRPGGNVERRGVYGISVRWRHTNVPTVQGVGGQGRQMGQHPSGRERRRQRRMAS